MIDIALQQLIAGVARVSGRVHPGSERVTVTSGLPRVIYTLITDPRTYTDSGAMGLRKANFQIDIFADTYAAARGITLRITARADNADVNYRGLDGYRGDIVNTRIHRIYFPGGESIGKADIDPGKSNAITRATVDAWIDYRELLPQPNFSTT